MSVDPRVIDLIGQWRSRCEPGREFTPEELCHDCPELLAAVRQAIDELRARHAKMGSTDLEQRTGPFRDEGSSEGVPAAAWDLPGRRYQPQQLHARGGLGEVYVAFDIELHRDVALKRIKASQADDSGCRRRFLREAEITARLQHPGIVPVYGLVEDDQGRPCYAMRFVEGRSLKGALDHFHKADTERSDPGERRLALRELLTAFVAVCKTLAYAHSRGIVHCDLKPANIMLGDYGETLVVDWGLARPFPRPGPEDAPDERDVSPSTGAGEDVTRQGRAMGTPAYLNPEQAEGQWDKIGPASDVCSLGATLYALLTGRAPFSGSGLAEILENVRSGNFPRPRQLEPTTPPALEAVCLKAMARQPEHRYATALELAADVEHWLADEPVTAYREPLPARLGRWIRRHRPLVASVTAALLVTVLLGGTGLWWLRQQLAARRQAGTKTAEKATELYQQRRWKEERTLLEQGQTELSGWGVDDLRQHLAGLLADLDLVDRLEGIRLARLTDLGSPSAPARADREYAQVLREAGLVRDGEPATSVAERVRATPAWEQVLVALDDWANVAQEPGRQAWLLEVARHVDPDPTRDRLRDPQAWANPVVLSERVVAVKVSDLTPPLLAALGQRLGKDGVGLLTEAQRRHAGDFWINFALGNALVVSKKPAEAVTYYRIALALRPKTFAVSSNLGNALMDVDRLDEALVEFTEAATLEPDNAHVQGNLGRALYRKGRLKEAIEQYRRAAALAPEDATIHSSLGAVLAGRGAPEEAIAEFHRALAIDPKDPEAHYNLGLALAGRGRWVEAIEHYRLALAQNRNFAQAHLNLGVALKQTNQADEALEAFQQAVRLDGRHLLAHFNLGVVLEAGGRLDEAIEQYRQAATLDPRDAASHSNLGLALTEKGRPDEAVTALRQAVACDPQLIQAQGALGQALQRTGNFVEARDVTRRALERVGAGAPVRARLSRQLQQCDRLLAVEARLPGLLKGEIKPVDGSEQLLLAQACQYKQLHATAAHLYDEGIRAAPNLVEDPRNGLRYEAAWSASMAGCGRCAEAARLDTGERARLRRQAVEWLTADLALWSRLAESGDARVREQVQRRLRRWKCDAHFDGLRDDSAVAQLPADERQACQKFWGQVDAALLQPRRPAP